MLNIEALLAPIPGSQPCGEDLAFSTEFDEIVKARQADDPTLEQGAWVAPLKEADWKFVVRRCSELLATRTKDLQLAAWLLEAHARTGGMAALGDALAVMAGLCERYWEGVYPLPDEDGNERRIGIVHWVVARLACLLKELPAIGNGAALDDVRACLTALDVLSAVLDLRLGGEGPSVSKARSAIEDVLARCTPASGSGAASAGSMPVPIERVVPPLPALATEGASMQREQALAQLRQLAGFFRRTEPHSPVAYLVEKAAQWGEQPLHAWLRAVIKDDAALARVDELLGIERAAGS